MNPIFKLIRLPNLIIIIVSQYLMRYCLINTFYSFGDTSLAMSDFNFALLVLSTLLIAVGGYIINDYFDVEIDKINKPEKAIIGKIISRQNAFLLYWVLTVFGVGIGFYIGFVVNDLMLGFVFLIIAGLLWYYSADLQKTLLLGNISVAIMSAMVILIVWLFEFYALKADPIRYVEAMKQLKMISLVTGAYALFAFLISLVREIIKDSEDVEGDKSAGFKTLAIKKGTQTAVNLVIVLVVITILLLAFGQYYLFTHGFSRVGWYLLMAVQSLLIYMLYLTFRAKSKNDFNFLSNTAKIVMAAGILSMQLFCVNF